jgi:peptidoglycan hydrolase CwlO-like protein
MFDWLLLSANLLLIGFLALKMYYYKNLSEKEKSSTSATRTTLEEAENLIRKYQIQLQRSLGDIDILNEELVKLRNDVKAIKSRNSQFRIENDRLKSKIKELENKIEALI